MCPHCIHHPMGMFSFRRLVNIIKKIFVISALSICFLFACSNNTENSNTNISIEETFDENNLEFTFRTRSLKKEHFRKHRDEFEYASADDYEIGANKVIKNKNALIKEEKEDGDYVYYIEATNEIVFLSKDGYIRSYFKPRKGKKYFDGQ